MCNQVYFTLCFRAFAYIALINLQYDHVKFHSKGLQTCKHIHKHYITRSAHLVKRYSKSLFFLVNPAVYCFSWQVYQWVLQVHTQWQLPWGFWFLEMFPSESRLRLLASLHIMNAFEESGRWSADQCSTVFVMRVQWQVIHIFCPQHKNGPFHYSSPSKIQSIETAHILNF